MYQNRRVSPICTTCEPLKNSVFVLKAKKNIILCLFLIVCAYFDKYTRYQKSPFMINNLKSTNMLISDLSLHKNHLFFVLKAKKFFFYYFSFFCVLFLRFLCIFRKICDISKKWIEENVLVLACFTYIYYMWASK